MKRSKPLPGVVFGAVGVFGVLTSFASTPRAQIAPLSVLYNPSVRSIAMGETGGADASDPTNAFINPAVLASGSRVYLSGFYEQLLGEFTSQFRLKGVYAGGGYAFPVGSGVTLSVAGQLRYALVDYGDVLLPGAPGPLGTVNPSDRHVGFALVGGVRIADKFSIGVGVTLKNWQIDSDIPGDDTASGNATDAGVRLAYTSQSQSGWETEVALAASVWNLNGEYQLGSFNLDFEHNADYALSVRSDGPTQSLGTGAVVPRVSLVFNLDVVVPERPDDNLVARLGGEFAAMQVLFLRLGWVIPETSDISVLTIGAGLGMPSDYFDVRFDFAVTPLEVLGSDVAIEDRNQKASLSVNVPLPLRSSGKRADGGSQ